MGMFLVFAGILLFLWGLWGWLDAVKTDAGITKESKLGKYREIEYNGKTYKYNDRITTVALIGTDSGGGLPTNEVFGKAARSDTILLAVLDDYRHRMSVIALDRNTMAKVQQYDLYGRKIGEGTKQLAYAFAEGEGAEISCENTAEAVSGLLAGIPVRYYAAMDMDEIPRMHVLGDPFPVTVPNDDLAALYPHLTAGSQVVLDASEVTDFLRYRDTAISYSNVGRMERQKAYAQAYLAMLKQYAAANDPETLFEAVERGKEEGHLLTNITRNKYLRFADSFLSLEEEAVNYYIPEGRYTFDGKLEQFYPNEEELLEHVVEIFYLED